MSTLTLPPYPAGTLQQQVMRQYSYLFQMSQQLNLALSQLEQTNRQSSEDTAKHQTAAKEETQRQYQTLKSMIVKTANRVEQRMEQLTAELAGEYVAVSDFGSYMEKLNAYIEANPEAITQYYSFYADLQADINKVSAAFSDYRTGTEGYIRTGIVYYDGEVPVYGVAVGQNLTTTVTDGEEVVDQNNFRATFTAKKLSFWQDSTEIAYVSNNQLYITNIVVLDSCVWASGVWQHKTAWHFNGSEGKRWHIKIWGPLSGAAGPTLPAQLPMTISEAARICSTR